MTTQTLRSAQSNLGSKGFKSLLADTVPALDVSSGPKLRPLLELVMKYLFPKPRDWIVEWTGPHGYDVIQDAVKNAKTSLSHDEVSLVVQYLRKSDVFGLAELEKAAGGEGELRNLLFGQTRLGKLMFGEKRYNPEKALPFEIDDEMQADLAKHFDAEALRPFNNVRKITELYSLYWCPAGVTVNFSEQIAKKHHQRLSALTWAAAHEEHGKTPTQADSWIQFPSDVFGRNKTVQQQEALIPRGFEFPHVQDVVFCVFMRFVYTGERLLSTRMASLRIVPQTYTNCQEKTKREKADGSIFWLTTQFDHLTVRGWLEGIVTGDPMISLSQRQSEEIGVAIVRKHR